MLERSQAGDLFKHLVRQGRSQIDTKHDVGRREEEVGSQDVTQPGRPRWWRLVWRHVIVMRIVNGAAMLADDGHGPSLDGGLIGYVTEPKAEQSHGQQQRPQGVAPLGA